MSDASSDISFLNQEDLRMKLFVIEPSGSMWVQISNESAASLLQNVPG